MVKPFKARLNKNVDTDVFNDFRNESKLGSTSGFVYSFFYVLVLSFELFRPFSSCDFFILT